MRARSTRSRLLTGGVLVAVLGLGLPCLALPSADQVPARLEPVFRNLASSDPQTAERAQADLRELWKMLWSRDIGPHLPQLAELLHADSATVREYAALTLAGAAFNDRQSARSLQTIAPDLISALQDPEPEVRRAAAATIAHLRPAPPPEATASLLPLLKDPRQETREAALAALSRIRPVPAELRDILMQQVREGSSLQAYAIRALRGMDSAPTPELVTLVTDRLDAPDPAVRTEAIQALGHWGAAGREALAKLQEIAADAHEDETLRMLARSAQRQIAGGDDAP